MCQPECVARSRTDRMLMHRVRSAACAGIALLAGIPMPVTAQSANRAAVIASLGIGPTATGDSLFEGSLSLSARVAVVLRVTQRLSLEASLNGAGPVSSSAYDVSGPTRRTRVYYSLWGLAAGGVINGGWGGDPERLTFQVGGGGYRTQGGSLEEQTTPTATSIAGYGGISVMLKRWSRTALALGARGLIIPSAKGERLWFVPLELSLRIR